MIQETLLWMAIYTLWLGESVSVCGVDSVSLVIIRTEPKKSKPNLIGSRFGKKTERFWILMEPNLYT